MRFLLSEMVGRLDREVVSGGVTHQILNLSSAVLKLSAKPVHLPAAFAKVLSLVLSLVSDMELGKAHVM